MLRRHGTRRTRSGLSGPSALPGVQGQQSVHAAEPYTYSGRGAPSWKSATDWLRQSTKSCFAHVSAARLAAALRLVDTGPLAGVDRGEPLPQERSARGIGGLTSTANATGGAGADIAPGPPGFNFGQRAGWVRDALNGYDPRRLDMLTPDRPRSYGGEKRMPCAPSCEGERHTRRSVPTRLSSRPAELSGMYPAANKAAGDVSRAGLAKKCKPAGAGETPRRGSKPETVGAECSMVVDVEISMKQPIRVLQWGLGAMGGGIARLHLDKPGLSIVAAVDGRPEFAGQDLAECLAWAST